MLSLLSFVCCEVCEFCDFTQSLWQLNNLCTLLCNWICNFLEKIGRRTHVWEDNIRINLGEMGWGLGLNSSGSGSVLVARSCEHDNKLPVPMKCEETLDYLKFFELLKECIPWSLMTMNIILVSFILHDLLRYAWERVAKLWGCDCYKRRKT
jgi:hypothetical protein